MNWIRATQVAPKNRQEILVARNEEFFIATFIAAENMFYCKNGVKFVIADDVKWAELLPPKD
jgi:hypothetical protein